MLAGASRFQTQRPKLGPRRPPTPSALWRHAALDYYTTRYRCCSQCCHIKTLAQSLGLVELGLVLVLLGGVIYIIYQQHSTQHSQPDVLRRSYIDMRKSHLPELSPIRRQNQIVEIPPSSTLRPLSTTTDICQNPQANIPCPYASFRFQEDAIRYGYYAALVILCIWTGTSVMLFKGLRRDDSLLVMPHLVMQVLGLLYSMLYLAFHLWRFLEAEVLMRYRPPPSVFHPPTLSCILIYLNLVLFETVYIIVGVKCWKYIRDVENQELFR